MRRALLILLLLGGCGGGGEGPAQDTNHGYGFQYDVQGVTGLKLRYSGAPPNLAFMQDTTYYETAFSQVEACSGLQAPAPFIILLKELDNDGYYWSKPSLILLKTSPYPSIIKHEMIHYLLDVNTGDLDPTHKSHLFTDCTL